VGQLVTRWDDQSSNGNHASQGTSANQPAAVAGGGLDFNDTNSASNASMMDFTGSSFNVPVNTDFLMFVVWNPESTNSNAYLSDSTAEVFQLTSGSIATFKTGSGAANTSMTHNSVFSNSTGEKSVFMIHRTNGSTGTIKLYKNGLVCNGHNNGGTVNPGTFDIKNLGSKNDASNWFDGIMYDIGVVHGGPATDKARQMITDYLCSKHGIERLG